MGACSSGAADPPNLCQVAERTYAYAGRTLSLEGFLRVSWHGSSLNDPGCGRGMAVSWSDDVPAFRELDAVADRAVWDTLMVKIRVTGQVRREQERERLGLRVWQLDIATAEVLSMEPIPASDGQRYSDWLDGLAADSFQPSRSYPPAVRQPTRAEAEWIGRECGVRVRHARMPEGILRLAAWSVYEPIDATAQRSDCFYHRIRLLVARPAAA